MRTFNCRPQAIRIVPHLPQLHRERLGSIALAFAPSAAGALTGTLHLTTNSLGVPGSQTVALSGTGTGSLATAPKAVLSAAALTFSNQGTWTTSASKTVVLSNPGGSP